MKYKEFELPEPSGYWILIEMDSRFVLDDNTRESKTAGGIIVTEKIVQQDNYGMSIATVVSVGPECYNKTYQEKIGAKKAWCKEGDKILVQAHSGRIVPHVSGTKFTHGRFQLITDQSVCGVYNTLAA